MNKQQLLTANFCFLIFKSNMAKHFDNKDNAKINKHHFNVKVPLSLIQNLI